MTSEGSGRTSQFRRHRWVRVTFIFVLAAAMASSALWPQPVKAGTASRFTGSRVFPKTVRYLVPEMKEILSNTFGVLVYQEQFTGGPSVRVSPNATFEIRWIADFVGHGKVELFDNPDGTGAPLTGKQTATSENDHTIDFDVAGVLQPDTEYYFKVTHEDPAGNIPLLTNTAPFPPVFTGAQTIGDVFVDAVWIGPGFRGTPTSSA